MNYTLSDPKNGYVIIRRDNVDRLLSMYDGDVVRLYLHLCMSDSSPSKESIMNALKLTNAAVDNAFSQLLAAGLVVSNDLKDAEHKTNQRKSTSELYKYTAAEIAEIVTGDNLFKGLVQITETSLLRPLNERELRALAQIIYDLHIPCECAALLVSHCKKRYEASHSDQTQMQMGYILDEAKRWNQNGYVTLEACEAYLKQYSAKEAALGQIINLFAIPRPRGRELTQIYKWIERGFSLPAIEMAYNIVKEEKNENWDIDSIDKICNAWYRDGIMTVEQIAEYEIKFKPKKRKNNAPKVNDNISEDTAKRALEYLKKKRGENK